VTDEPVELPWEPPWSYVNTGATEEEREKNLHAQLRIWIAKTVDAARREGLPGLEDIVEHARNLIIDPTADPQRMASVLRELVDAWDVARRDL
jgi:allophanate hydrolase subunit 1